MTRMEQLHDALVLEQLAKDLQIVDGKRVDDDHLVVCGHLHQAQLRIVGFLAQELGIDRQHARFAGSLYERFQIALRGYVHA